MKTGTCSVHLGSDDWCSPGLHRPHIPGFTRLLPGPGTFSRGESVARRTRTSSTKRSSTTASPRCSTGRRTRIAELLQAEYLQAQANARERRATAAGPADRARQQGVAHVFSETRRRDVRSQVGDGRGPRPARCAADGGAARPGRIAALDVPGIDPFSLVFSGRQFTPSAETGAFLAAQVSLLESFRTRRPAGRGGHRQLPPRRQRQARPARRPRGAMDPERRRRGRLLIGARFGKGGGDEARRAQFLSALQQRLGNGAGRRSSTTCASRTIPSTTSRCRASSS
jgi:hypothetical protein